MADYAYSRTRRLEEKGYRPEQEWKPRGMVSVSEKGKSYKVEISRALASAVFSIDGNVIKQGHKCDKFLSPLPMNLSLMWGELTSAAKMDMH